MHTQEEGKAGAAGQLSLGLTGERRGFRANVETCRSPRGSVLPAVGPQLEPGAGRGCPFPDDWMPGRSFGTETKREPEPRLGRRLWDGGASGEETPRKQTGSPLVSRGRSWA